MKFDKIKISPEQEGLIISLGVVVLGNLIKSKNRDVGNMVQGLGIGAGAGTVAHQIDQEYKNNIPHHDAIALASIPTVFVLDKTNVIKNKDLVNNLYGIGLGVLSQHLLTEGCSFCNTYYCHDGKQLC